MENKFTSTPDSRIWDFSPMRLGAAKRRGNRRNRWMIIAQIKLTPQLQDRRLHTRWFHFQARGPSRNNLRGPMENARVERRQFHSMSFGQFGKVQIGKLSARFRGDSLR